MSKDGKGLTGGYYGKFDLTGSTYKPKDVKAYELRKRRKALKIRLELQGLDDEEIKKVLASLS